MNTQVASLLHGDDLESVEVEEVEELLHVNVNADVEDDEAVAVIEVDEENETTIDLTDEALAVDTAAAPTVEEEDDEDDVQDPDVEVSLDEILRTRLDGSKTVEDETEAGAAVEEDQEIVIVLASGEEDGPRPRGADEFLCWSCFLVKHQRQLVDPTRSICVDCVDT
jgi:hypothetical protein